MPSFLQIPADKFLVIAGPCVIESRELCFSVAKHVAKVCASLGLPYVFKASFDKANRSSGSSYRGPGLTDGLATLHAIKEELGLPVLTDVHEVEQVHAAGEVVDVLQVPAFLARQTDLLLACGRTGKAVNVKKGQFMSPQEMGNAAEKVRSTGNANVLLTDRGTFFGYNRLVNDFTCIPIMQSFGVPVVFDATHSTQQPGALGTGSGGNPALTPLLARAAIAAGANGLFIECHPDPKNAKSDASSMVKLDDVEAILSSCAAIAALRPSWR
jgi:2-dehydro-3-deoxyphosphooctonate aldolase (KDO 8-P synthase)